MLLDHQAFLLLKDTWTELRIYGHLGMMVTGNNWLTTMTQELIVTISHTTKLRTHKEPTRAPKGHACHSHEQPLKAFTRFIQVPWAWQNDSCSMSVESSFCQSDIHLFMWHLTIFWGAMRTPIHATLSLLALTLPQKVARWQSFHCAKSRWAEACSSRVLHLYEQAFWRLSLAWRGWRLTFCHVFIQFVTVPHHRHWWLNKCCFRSSVHRLSTYMGPMSDVL